MEVATFPGVKPFLAAAGPLLLADAARNHLPLGICHTLGEHPDVYPAFHLWAAIQDGTASAAALITEPWNLVLVEPASAAALDALVEPIRSSGVRPPGVVANVPWADRFARAWSGTSGVTPRLLMAQGVYALTAVRDVPATPGRMRPATVADRGLLRNWLRDFFHEAVPHSVAGDDERVERLLDVRLGSADDLGLWLWEEDGDPVSLSGFSTSLRGSRIGPVYTPPDLRGRGYATNLVARQSEWLLERGASPVCLFADLANPTSNAIYTRIGFERICDANEIAFDLAE